LVLRGRAVGVDASGGLRGVVMAIVNRTADSFYVPARAADVSAALAAAHRAWAQGAEILDVGGVRAGVGPAVEEAEEIDRVVPVIEQVRTQLPDLLVSVDTWRSGVARAAIAAGVDLINDTWAGADPELVEVAGAGGVGIVCSHTGGLTPRTDPYRVAYPAQPGTTDERDGVVADVVDTLRHAAARAVAAGVPANSILIDPTHDFGKNTWHSLHLLRHTQALAALGYPLLVALSRKDFVGETLRGVPVTVDPGLFAAPSQAASRPSSVTQAGLGPDDRLEGTLAATAIAAWLGARVFRAHDVAATRRVLDLVAVLRDEAAPAAVLRALG
jgi:dihydropteroate synthase